MELTFKPISAQTKKRRQEMIPPVGKDLTQAVISSLPALLGAGLLIGIARIAMGMVKQTNRHRASRNINTKKQLNPSTSFLSS